MKKLLLLMAAGLTVSSAFAQYGNNSVVFNNFHETAAQKIATNVAPQRPSTNMGTANKTTGGAKEGWYSYVNVMATTNVKGWYSVMYNDSTTRSTDGTSFFFNKLHGTGFSFDAYSSVWDNDFVDINSIPGFSIAKTQGYTLDSFFYTGYYQRRKNTTDTLFIDFVKTGAANTFSIQYGPDPSLATYSTDSAVRNFMGTYDADNNKMSDSINLAAAGSLVRMTIILDAAYFADSTGTLSHAHAVKLPGSGLSVGANQGVVAYVHFKGGASYPLGTLSDTINCWRSYTYELGGEDTNPFQVKKERNAGLVSTWESRYAPYFTFQGHKVIIPTTLYGPTSGNDWPDYAFYVKCADCENAGVKNVTGIIGSVKAFPNPANNEVSMPVTVNKAANVTVSLINTLGQNVATQNLGKVAAGTTATATFSTSNLSAGIYVYSVNADGQVMTGRVVVAH